MAPTIASPFLSRMSLHRSGVRRARSRPGRGTARGELLDLQLVGFLGGGEAHQRGLATCGRWLTNATSRSCRTRCPTPAGSRPASGGRPLPRVEPRRLHRSYVRGDRPDDAVDHGRATLVGARSTRFPPSGGRGRTVRGRPGPRSAATSPRHGVFTLPTSVTRAAGAAESAATTEGGDRLDRCRDHHEDASATAPSSEAIGNSPIRPAQGYDGLSASHPYPVAGSGRGEEGIEVPTIRAHHGDAFRQPRSSRAIRPRPGHGVHLATTDRVEVHQHADHVAWSPPRGSRGRT